MKAIRVHALDHTKPGYLNAVSDLSAGRGANIILEMLANINLAADIEIAAPNGRIVVMGSRGAVMQPGAHGKIVLVP